MPYSEHEKKKSEIVEMHPRSWGGQQVIRGWWKLQGVVRPNRNGLLSQGLGWSTALLEYRPQGSSSVPCTASRSLGLIHRDCINGLLCLLPLIGFGP